MSTDTNRASIIESIKTPIGFFALAVLSVEAILTAVLLKVNSQASETIAYLMIGTLVLTLICVMILSYWDRNKNRTKGMCLTKPESQDKNEKHVKLHLSDYEILQKKMSEYADKHKSKRITFFKGDRLIKKDDIANDIFLLEDGNLIIDDESGKPKEEKEIKWQGAIVGEASVMGKNRKRSASVYIYSDQARIVKLSRDDIHDMAADDEVFKKALQYLFRLYANRIEKVALYCGSGIQCNVENCTVLMGDIHSFSRLSEKVTDEIACPFRFKFTDQSKFLSNKYKGIFEDQGDGYKIIFKGTDHIYRAMKCSLEICDGFSALIKEFTNLNESFKEVGLGIGIYSDDFTILNKPDGTEYVLGHGIVVAAAMSKCRNSIDEIIIRCNPELIIKVDTNIWKFKGPYELSFDKLEKKYQHYILTEMTDIKTNK